MALTAGEIVTFGQCFREGLFRRGAGLRVTGTGGAINSQIDVKSRHPDGSARFALVSVVNPGGGSTAALSLRPCGAYRPHSTTAAQAAQAIVDSGYNVSLELTGGLSTTVNFATLLQSAINAGALDVWMHGPLATEIRVRQTVDVHFVIEADIRRYSTGAVRTAVTVSNDRIVTIGGKFREPSSKTYSWAIKSGASTLASGSNLTQWSCSRWIKRVWTGSAAPVARTLFNFDEWQNAKAIPLHDTSIPASESTMASVNTAYGSASNGPLGVSLWEQFMGQTGGRYDLGMFTGWQALYLASGDKRMETVVKGMADCAGGIPWHWRHETTHGIMTIDEFPTTFIVPSDPPNYRPSQETFDPDYVGNGGNWKPDAQHRPQCTALAYLITGDRYYLDELIFDAAALMIGRDGYRLGSFGSMHTSAGRGMAWTWRTMTFAWMYAQSRADRDYFSSKLNNNCDWYIDKINNFFGNIEYRGFSFYPDNSGINTWMDEMFGQALAFATRAGHEKSRDYLLAKANWLAGRYISSHLGYKPKAATVYSLHVDGGVSSPDDGMTWSSQNISQTTWAALMTKAQEWQPGYDFDNGNLYETNIDSYAAQALGQLACSAAATGDIRFIEAWAWVVGQTFAAFAGGKQSTKAWLFYTILPDGTKLKDGNTLVASAAGTVNGSSSSQVIYALPGSTVNATAGNNVVYVRSGNNTLNGGTGNDYIFAGIDAGDDIINPGPGQNHVKCGHTGTTRIDFGAANTGADRIYNFSQSRGDRLNVLPSLTTTQANALIAAAVDVDGSAVLTLASGKTVTMVGHPKATMASNWFVTS